MKRILAPILLMTLLFPALAFGETMKDLVEREGIHYKKFTEVPFTGKVTGKTQGSFKNGKKDGPWVQYHDNGQLMDKGTFKNGRWYGPWVSYWKNGQLLLKSIYENGFSNGPYVSYHATGQLNSKGTYKNGKQDGPWVYYKKDGTVDKISTGTYKDGVKVK
jgi:antitoxin component YwqK of YwqJK toxin-antitoxin module